MNSKKKNLKIFQVQNFYDKMSFELNSRPSISILSFNIDCLHLVYFH